MKDSLRTKVQMFMKFMDYDTMSEDLFMILSSRLSVERKLEYCKALHVILSLQYPRMNNSGSARLVLRSIIGILDLEA